MKIVMDPIRDMKVSEMKRELEERKSFEQAVDRVIEKSAPVQAKDGIVLPLRLFPDDCLKQKCRPVEKFDKGLRELVANMSLTMYLTGGIGLAAPQIGQSIRVFVCDLRAYAKGSPSAFRVFVNPEITAHDGNDEMLVEGCLSFPSLTEKIARPDKVHIRYQDERGKHHEQEATGMLARVVQHENDHLDGILMIDRMGRLQRRMALKRLHKRLGKSISRDIKSGKWRR